jgi:hypothetical protein
VQFAHQLKTFPICSGELHFFCKNNAENAFFRRLKTLFAVEQQPFCKYYKGIATTAG